MTTVSPASARRAFVARLPLLAIAKGMQTSLFALIAFTVVVLYGDRLVAYANQASMTDGLAALISWVRMVAERFPVAAPIVLALVTGGAGYLAGARRGG
jgi:hypothetical protein